MGLATFKPLLLSKVPAHIRVSIRADLKSLIFSCGRCNKTQSIPTTIGKDGSMQLTDVLSAAIDFIDAHEGCK